MHSAHSYRDRLVTASRALPLAICAALAAGAVVGCATPPAADRARVSQAVEARFGQPVLSGPRAQGAIVPEALQAGEPLTEEQAVVLALWNNAAFHEQLV